MAKLLPTNDAAPIDRGRADVAQATYQVEHRFDLLMHAVDLEGHEFMVRETIEIKEVVHG